MFRSPWKVISVLGWLVRILSTAAWIFFSMPVSPSGFVVGLFGLRYRLIMVCMGLVFCLLSWIWRMHVAMLGMVMSFGSMNVTCRLVL